MSERGLPLDLLILVLIVMPCGIAVFFGLFAFKHMTPNVFRCSRCHGEFQRKAWRPFPSRCALCRARDWNLPPQ